MELATQKDNFSNHQNSISLEEKILSKQNLIKDFEQKIQFDIEYLEIEKKRMNKQKDEFQLQKEAFQIELEKEKETLKKEYARLDALQEQIKLAE